MRPNVVIAVIAVILVLSGPGMDNADNGRSAVHGIWRKVHSLCASLFHSFLYEVRHMGIVERTLVCAIMLVAVFERHFCHDIKAWHEISVTARTEIVCYTAFCEGFVGISSFVQETRHLRAVGPFLEIEIGICHHDDGYAGLPNRGHHTLS